MFWNVLSHKSQEPVMKYSLHSLGCTALILVIDLLTMIYQYWYILLPCHRKYTYDTCDYSDVFL